MARFRPTEAATQNPALRLIFEAPARAKPGEPVPLVFTVTNPTDQPITLYLMGRTPTADFLISDARGREVWSLRHGETVQASLQVYPLGAGKTLTFRHRWNQRANTGMPVPAGSYLGRGILLTDRPGGLVTPVMKLRIL